MSVVECLPDQRGLGIAGIGCCRQPGSEPWSDNREKVGKNGAQETNSVYLTCRSTKGASKQRRDLINGEIIKLRELLPLSEAAKQRLSQLQVMSFVSVYIRKSNYFARLFEKTAATSDKVPYQFSQSLDGFHLAITNCGKLLHISINVIEYLGHSSVDMMTQGDTLFDIVDKRDHAAIEAFLQRGDTSGGEEELTFFCRMTVSRNFRRQTGYGDHKVMHVRGRFVAPKYLDQFSNQSVFLATCRPFVTPEVNESTVVNSTSLFQSVHRLNMNYMEMSPNGCHYLGYTDDDIRQKSWYDLLHPDDVVEAAEKHKQLIRSSREMGCMLTVRLQTKAGEWLWTNMVLHVRQPFSGDSADAAIICINQVLLDSEAPLFKMQSQLFSTQMARGPEFPSMVDGQAQMITQQPQANVMSSMLALDTDQSPFYNGELSGLSCNPGQDEQQPLAGGLTPFGDDFLLNGNTKILQKKDIIRAGLLRKLKRKASEVATAADNRKDRGVCHPAKRTRLVVNGNASNHGQRLPYIGSILSTSERTLSQVSSTVNSGPQLMNVVSQGRIYTQLLMKKDIGISRETRRLPATGGQQAELTIAALNSLRNLTPPCDVGPLTPESLVSDCGSPGSVTDLTINITEPLLPFALTPEPSPVQSSPDYPLTPPPMPGCEQRVPSLIGDFEEHTFCDEVQQDLFEIFDAEQVLSPPKKPVVAKSNSRLPVLDVSSVNQFLGDIEEKKNRLNCQLRQVKTTVEEDVANELKMGPTSSAVAPQQSQCAEIDTSVTHEDIDQFMMVPDGMPFMSSPQKSHHCGSETGNDDEGDDSSTIFMDVMNELDELDMFANSAVFGSDDKMCSSLFDQTL